MFLFCFNLNEVVIGCRSEKRAKQAVEDLIKDSELEDTSKLKLVIMDLSSLETIQQVPAKLDELGVSKLDCLINNAGLMALPEYRETTQGDYKDCSVSLSLKKKSALSVFLFLFCDKHSGKCV